MGLIGGGQGMRVMIAIVILTILLTLPFMFIDIGYATPGIARDSEQRHLVYLNIDPRSGMLTLQATFIRSFHGDAKLDADLLVEQGERRLTNALKCPTTLEREDSRRLNVIAPAMRAGGALQHDWTGALVRCEFRNAGRPLLTLSGTWAGNGELLRDVRVTLPGTATDTEAPPPPPPPATTAPKTTAPTEAAGAVETAAPKP